MTRAQTAPSQVTTLLLHVAAGLGYSTDRDVATLVGVSAETVANWRSGSVRDLKSGTFADACRRLIGAITDLQDGAASTGGSAGLSPVEVEDGSGPSDLLRQLRERIPYDYLGHRFLYFEPQGALAWENLIREGYQQDKWLAGVETCAKAWSDPKKDRAGRAKGPLAQALRLGQAAGQRGLDLVSLGSGEGDKDACILREVQAASGGRPLPWVTYAPVDVSIPLLVRAGRQGTAALRGDSARGRVIALCADFEEGPLSFVGRLPSARRPDGDGLRLIVLLGNIFGNLRNEDRFVRQKLQSIARKGDLVWLEVALRLPRLEDDPLFRMTVRDRAQTAGEANRRILLEGPYRRWEAASGRRPSELDVRVWVREDDESTPVPGSANFCHDLVLLEERRACTMLYSRRYAVEPLARWFEERGFAVERLHKVADPTARPGVVHLLLRRT